MNTEVLFWVKYVILGLALGICPLSKVACGICLVIYIALDMWHGELLEKRGRMAMLTKVVRRKVDQIIREERSAWQKSSNQD